MRRISQSQVKDFNKVKQLRILQRKVQRLKRENLDLKIALTTTAEHGDFIMAQTHALNLQLKAKADEHQRTAAQLTKLLDMISQEKDDLEMILQTLTEHGDAVDEHWQEKLDEAVILASLDGLTQIANRRRFDEHLIQQWKQMKREKACIALILCDIDHFKKYNDLYGHPTGDACLKQVAQAMDKAVMRPIDLVARYGGEEFAVILPKTDEQGAVIVAQRIQSAITQLHIPHARSDTHPFVTLSVGVSSTIPDKNHSWSDLVDAADRALYQSKEEGRNQISTLSSLQEA